MESIVDLNKRIQAIREKRKKIIGENLTRYRQSAKYTQVELSEILGVERTTVTNIESGKQNMTIELLIGVCEAFHITANDMLSGVYMDDGKTKSSSGEKQNG